MQPKCVLAEHRANRIAEAAIKQPSRSLRSSYLPESICQPYWLLCRVALRLSGTKYLRGAATEGSSTLHVIYMPKLSGYFFCHIYPAILYSCCDDEAFRL